MELVLAIALVTLQLGRRVLSRKPSTVRKPVGKVRPFWIRMADIYALLSVFDLLVIVLFIRVSNYSEFTQPVALYLMATFLPIAYFASFLFRGAFLELVDEEFSFPLSNPSTLLWVTSALAKALLKLRQQRGVLYLRKSLTAARKVFERAGRSSDSLNEAIDFLYFVWETGIQADLDKLLAFADAVFAGDSLKIEKLPEDSQRLVDAFDWFSKTQPLNKGKQGSSSRLTEGVSRYIGGLLRGVGIGGTLVAVSQLFVQSLPSIGSTLQAQQSTIIVVVFVIVVSYIPALNLKALFDIFVNFSDLSDYEREDQTSRQPSVPLIIDKS